MKKEIIINSSNEETRIAIIEDGLPVEIFVERPEAQRMVGDIYKGRVSRVIPGMQAAFINIGHAQNAFLHFSDVSSSTHQFIDNIDEDSGDEEEQEQVKTKADRKKKKYEAIRNLKDGQEIVVQILKEPIGTKGPRVTSQITIPGRFEVLMPNEPYVGVSRKISDYKEKKRLKKIVRSALPQNFGLIVRTVAEGKPDSEIISDIRNLVNIWNKIEQKIQVVKPPSLVYKDMGMASSVIRDLFTSDVAKVVVDSRKLMREISLYVKDVAPQLRHKIEYYKDKSPIFDSFNIESEIDKSMNSKVWLKNGAYLVIQQTEAMAVIDVNSGKFIGRKDHETNSLNINLEAAKEIARQVRLRDLGGLIVIDFIDVIQEENKRRIYNELKREFNKDRAINKIEPMSRFGLIEMTRQRVRESVIHAINDECPQCSGSGLVPTLNNLMGKLERWIKRYRAGKGDRRITIRVTEDMYKYMTQGRFSRKLQLMWKYWMKINFVIDSSLEYRKFKVFDRKNKKEISLNGS